MFVSKKLLKSLIKEWLSPLLIVRVNFLSSFFVIKKSSGSWRFILKLEDCHSAGFLLSASDFLIAMDLEDAYLFLSVHQENKKFLRFCFQSQLFQFIALLASASYIFTKILRLLLFSLRERKFLSNSYLDDFFLVKPLLKKCFGCIKYFLSSLDFIINERKSVFISARSCCRLSFIFDTEYLSISIPLD